MGRCGKWRKEGKSLCPLGWRPSPPWRILLSPLCLRAEDGGLMYWEHRLTEGVAMSRIKPFRAYRPRPELAARVASFPYDVINSDEARELA